MEAQMVPPEVQKYPRNVSISYSYCFDILISHQSELKLLCVKFEGLYQFPCSLDQ